MSDQAQPDSLLWNMSGGDLVDPERPRIVEIRIDAPLPKRQLAIDVMDKSGWALASAPDPDSELHQRLFFRRVQTILDDQKRDMFRTAYRAAEASGGPVHSWLVEEDFEE